MEETIRKVVKEELRHLLRTEGVELVDVKDTTKKVSYDKEHFESNVVHGPKKGVN